MMKSKSYIENRDLAYNVVNEQENQIRSLINPTSTFLQYFTKKYNVQIRKEIVEELSISLTVILIF